MFDSGAALAGPPIGDCPPTKPRPLPSLETATATTPLSGRLQLLAGCALLLITAILLPMGVAASRSAKTASDIPSTPNVKPQRVSSSESQPASNLAAVVVGRLDDEPLLRSIALIDQGRIPREPSIGTHVRGRNLVITRSQGILDTSPFDGSTRRRMQFDGLPKFCFLVHQLRNSAADDVTRIPIDAECRERPPRILLNPQKPFFVQVNNVQDDHTKSDGTLDFWVKILS